MGSSSGASGVGVVLATTKDQEARRTSLTRRLIETPGGRRTLPRPSYPAPPRVRPPQYAPDLRVVVDEVAQVVGRDLRRAVVRPELRDHALERVPVERRGVGLELPPRLGGRGRGQLAAARAELDVVAHVHEAQRAVPRDPERLRVVGPVDRAVRGTL